MVPSPAARAWMTVRARTGTLAHASLPGLRSGPGRHRAEPWMAAVGQQVRCRPMRGLDEEKVSAWLAEHVEGATPPFEFRLIAGGRSNLTFAADDSAGHHYVVRRPPLGHVLATAHDMAREHRLI